MKREEKQRENSKKKDTRRELLSSKARERIRSRRKQRKIEKLSMPLAKKIYLLLIKPLLMSLPEMKLLT